MPEGDTVFRTAARLHALLSGRVITEFDLRVPQAATVDLRGQTVDAVVPRGKHILHRIGEHTLHTHLKMEGSWQDYAPGERWRVPAFRARAVVSVAGRQTVGFDIADIAVVPRSEEAALTAHLGPDPLADDWDPREAARRLHADTRPIHVALLDQRNVAGFGNEYANELLFVRGIDPHTPATAVDVAGLLDTGARMMLANRDRMIRTFTGDSRRGRSTWVFGRERGTCRRCGTPVQRTSLGADPTRERNVFWCPSCQR